jgi:4-amino-4-deoxy-L-arabinose transferase-like glycosyltransferase
VFVTPSPALDANTSPPSRGALVALWIASLLVLLAGLGRPVVTRTQEARVLETAREMLGTGFHGWMVPRLNDEVRLHKPPLAYWASAASFKLFGVNEFAGRLPSAIAGWLTIAVTFALARRLVGLTAGFFAAAALLSSFMFFKFARLAETDVLATLFVTAAIYHFVASDHSITIARRLIHLHLAGAHIGLAVLAKGPPAAFALLFLLVWGLAQLQSRARWRTLGWFFLGGAWLTAAAVAGWWFLYVRGAPEWDIIGVEMRAIARGRQHTSAFYLYFPWLLVVTGPWSALAVLGLVWVAIRSFFMPNLRAVFVWALVIFVPLCAVGQRQAHYLIPIIPAMAVAVGYAIAHALDPASRERERREVRVLFYLTAAVCCFGGVALVVASRISRGYITTGDLLMGGLLTAVLAIPLIVGRARGLAAAVPTFAGAAAVSFALIMGYWVPSLEPDNHRVAAAAIREKFGDGPYVLYGHDGSDPMLFNLRAVAPEVRDEARLAQVLRERPRTIVIAQTKNKVEPPPLPPGLQKHLELRVGDEGMVFRIYALSGVSPQTN